MESKWAIGATMLLMGCTENGNLLARDLNQGTGGPIVASNAGAGSGGTSASRLGAGGAKVRPSDPGSVVAAGASAATVAGGASGIGGSASAAAGGASINGGSQSGGTKPVGGSNARTGAAAGSLSSGTLAGAGRSAAGTANAQSKAGSSGAGGTTVIVAGGDGVGGKSRGGSSGGEAVGGKSRGGSAGVAGIASGAAAGSSAVPCSKHSDCKLYTDCCTCVAIGASEPLPVTDCGPFECAVSACHSRGVDTAECRDGKCVLVGSDCDASHLTCSDPAPTCPKDWAPNVIGGCWGSCIPRAKCGTRFEYSCSACSPDWTCAATEYPDSPRGYSCPMPQPSCSTKDCACAGATICPSGYTCIDHPSDADIECRCPGC